ncbi:septal ring lytic transglycosylase RlpA family protein [Aeromonas caviae]|uniref:septal ring lytic transglycosylase RlpA family protein n=1 Tax=Aeromonas caviae TaxID=648 RepID=UPI000FE3BC20|nr:septal ring lytic transglycosylase RlpA family protein [Aeromonas caviae]MEA9442085.1 septal ring lytic transglycosylase RlpA family protein [Aeromonas caviae]RWS96540.1 septal ring lytic transglycosylase RlpA family lipoprotein [Aeromonas caviae]RWT03358.1 septal ring lytic transglycosylase RlpA family lipoprotein [Aeromonas caviae]
MITMVQKGVLIPLSLLLAACSSQPQAGEDGSVRGYTQTGLASYYADRYHNKRTASGELHKRGGNTAAHMTLPFGTQVKVTNLANGKSVMVRVNDRGNFARGRIIDLSRAAFSAIGNPRSGLIKVRIEVL